MTELILFIGLIGLLAAGVIIAIRRLGHRRTAAMLAEFDEPALVTGANFFGRQSDGLGQIRGNGTLMLTRQALIFDLWLPHKRVMVPLDAITDISTPRSFLGKTKGRPLLRVDYTTEAGEPDAVAWAVRNLDDVISMIRARM